MHECELCGYQSTDETEFQTVETGLDGGYMTWEEIWCKKCVAQDDLKDEVAPAFAYDERVIVDFGGCEEYHGEIDAIDFEGDPEYPYRVWYDVPRIEMYHAGQLPVEVECEWVRASMLRRAKNEGEQS